MATIYDVDQQELVERTAEELKKVTSVKPPVWAAYVKTGVNKERPPANDDWWYFRVASILRNVYKLGPVGVNKLKVKYGGKKRRGVAPPITTSGSGSIIRKALQQLEKAGFVKHNEKGVHKGKTITPLGKNFLNNIAKEIIKSPRPKKEREVKEFAEKPKPAEIKKPEIKNQEIKKPRKEEPRDSSGATRKEGVKQQS